MAVTWTDIYNECIPEVGGIDKRIVLRKLYLACHEFCQQSEVWRHIQTQSVVASQADYTLALPTVTTKATIKRLAGVWYGSESNLRLASDIVEQAKYQFVYPNILRWYTYYYPTSAMTNGLTTEIVLVPNLDEAKVSDQIMDQWGIRAFIPGAIGEILGMAEEQWTDLSRARQHQLTFRKMINNAKAEIFRRYCGGDVRVAPRYCA